MSKRKRKRIPYATFWMVELDKETLNKLPPAEQAWYQKFVDEYYLTEFKTKNPLHSPGQRKQLVDAKNARERDITTATDNTVREHLSKQYLGTKKNQYYSPEDWKFTENSGDSLEDEIIDKIDREAEEDA